MDRDGNLNPREAFQAGFWDGLQDKPTILTEFGWNETDFGSVRPDFRMIYDYGRYAGQKLRNNL